MSNVTPGDRRGVPTRMKEISLEQFALLPLALIPLVSRKENVFPAPPSPCFRPTSAEQWKSCRFNVLPQLSVLDQIKHATCVAKFIQYMCLVLLRIPEQTGTASSRVSVPWSHAST